ncbi:MAG TPA: hypothetical protein VMG82_26525 [Candidatus Sulfotelmatobacter sp.]|nr:hypothetical protein [Candidatus Sulfotelmatobacter sp.]
MRHLSELKPGVGLRRGLLLTLTFASNAVAHGQSCALCYTQAASAGHRLIQGLRTGILVLIVPPMFMSAGITLLAYKKRNRTNDNDKAESRNSSDTW